MDIAIKKTIKMDNTEAITKLLKDKQGAYQKLLDCIRKERKAIISSDTSLLWKIAEEKKCNIHNIVTIQQSIRHLCEDAGIVINTLSREFKLSEVLGDFLSASGNMKKNALWEIFSGINRLKDQIKAEVALNVSFIKEYLSVVDDMVGILITGQSASSKGYGRGFDRTQSASSVYNNSARLILQEA